MDDEERRRWRGDGVAQEEETKVNDLVTAAFTTRNKRADGPKCPVFTSQTVRATALVCPAFTSCLPSIYALN